MQENYISKMAEGKIVELSSTIIPLSLQVRNKNYKCLIRRDKLPILKLLAHTICKVYHHHAVFSSDGLTGIRRVYHNTSFGAYTIQLIIIKLQTKYQIIPINTSQENFDRKLILTD